MKTCFKCGIEKPLSEFHTHKQMADGHLNKCKTCVCEYVRSHRATNRSFWAAYDREREQRPERKAAKLRYAKTYRKRHPEKLRAHNAVNRAVKSGKLVKTPCEVCGATLDVRWLCNAHHAIAHGKQPIINPQIRR